MAQSRADDWCSRGGHFSWRPADGEAPAVEIFHVELGAVDAPVLLLIHGWPTSSIDWYGVAEPLSRKYRVCALDFPGYGFSDKPLGWGYSLARDAELVEYYLAAVVGAQSAVVVAHDRGDSVALQHAARSVAGRSAVALEHLVLSNGNIFLPLSQLTQAQLRILDPKTGPEMAALMTPAQLAEGMGATTFTPARSADDPDIEALKDTFSHADGIKVVHETIQYLVDRSRHEQQWLSVLDQARFPITLVWGVYDTVSPPRVASYVWSRYLMLKPTGNRLYFVPDANHYLQVDRPQAFVSVLLDALDPTDGQPPGPLGPELAAPLLVDSSRAELPNAGDLIRPEAPRGS